MTMSKEDFDLLVSEELAACDRLLRSLEDDYNSPERIARRSRIEEHIGRPLYRDDLQSRKQVDLDDEHVIERIDLFRRLGTPEFLQAADIMEMELERIKYEEKND